MADTLRSKHVILLNKNLEDVDLIKTTMSPVESKTAQMDVKA